MGAFDLLELPPHERGALLALEIVAGDMTGTVEVADATWQAGTVLEGAGLVAIEANADGILLDTLVFDGVPTAIEASVLVRSAVVNGDALNYNGKVAANVDAALLALGIRVDNEHAEQGIS